MQVLVLDRDDALHDERARIARADHAGHEVHALEDGRPALRRRALERRVDAHEHVPRLVEEPEDRGVARLLLLRPRERELRLEARVVNRRHELLREERAHRLPDEVGGRHAGDAEPMRRFRRDGRLARAGRSADEQQERLVEPLQRVDPAQPANGARRLLLADELGGELAQAVEVERQRAAFGKVAVRTARDQVGALRDRAP